MGVEIELVLADFRETPPIEADAAANLFSAGIGYLGEEEDLKALRSLHRALKPGALFLLDTMNLFWLARNYQPRGWDENEEGTRRRLEAREFDFLTGRNRSQAIFWERGREERRSAIDMRIYSPTELVRLLEQAGFETTALYGDLDGSDFGFDSRRIVMVSRRI
jgi:hypothetical protein